VLFAFLSGEKLSKENLEEKVAEDWEVLFSWSPYGYSTSLCPLFRPMKLVELISGANSRSVSIRLITTALKEILAEQSRLSNYLNLL